MASTTDLAISGLASGFDWQSLVTQLITVERAPETRMRSDQTTIQQKNNAYGSIKTQMGVLSNRLDVLKDPSLFASRLATTSDSTLASATADAGALVGIYNFNITQLATSAVLQGSADSGKALNDTDDVSGLVLSDAGFASGITAGTFTVNGKIITIAASDTLQSVFDQISTATDGAVTGSYSAADDKISLSSSGEIVLGSATDTSNFLQAAKLFNNGTGTIQSATSLGAVKLGSVLSSANFATTVSDGGSGSGVFKINGVEISFNASTDIVSGVLKRINDSNAGVTASYDSVNDRFVLTNKATGDVGVAMEDVTGNFLAATGLVSGTLKRGNNLLYTINDGGQLVSQSNTITSDSSALTGVSVTALKTGSVSIGVNTDTDKIEDAINGFITEYNNTQNLIDSKTASTTDSNGVVTAGILTGETDANSIASTLRRLTTSTSTSLSGLLKNLDSLGIVSNGNDNTITLSDNTKLDDALANHLNDVQDLFTNASSGLAVGLSDYIENTIGDDGTLTSHQASLTKQSNDIDTNIANMERTILADQDRLTNSFIAMESAQSQINQQMQYLSQFINSGS
ncbi:MAG TPA: flagellar filament capping protein FliD [Verrucomicrobiae bacterium]|nr:flagellar filament capping protein FliD [Verrucomicrobiae bacterium]